MVNLPPTSFSSALLWKCFTKQAETMWTLTIYWSVSYSGTATIRDLVYFWGTAWMKANNGRGFPANSALGPGCLCIPQSSIFPHLNCPWSGATLQHGVSKSRVFTQFRTWCMVREAWEIWQSLEQTSPCSASGQACIYSVWVKFRLLTALLTLPDIFQIAKGVCLPWAETQDLGI